MAAPMRDQSDLKQHEPVSLCNNAHRGKEQPFATQDHIQNLTKNRTIG